MMLCKCLSRSHIVRAVRVHAICTPFLSYHSNLPNEGKMISSIYDFDPSAKIAYYAGLKFKVVEIMASLS